MLKCPVNAKYKKTHPRGLTQGCLTIQKSKDITAIYQYIINEFVDDEDASKAYQGDIQHVDESMNALEKNQKIDWLKAEIPENSVKILSNIRFLREDVDVPNLDAVIFP